jgi:hypothetical protein
MVGCRLAPRVDVSDTYEVIEDCATLMRDLTQASGECCESERHCRSHCTDGNCGRSSTDLVFHCCRRNEASCTVLYDEPTLILGLIDLFIGKRGVSAIRRCPCYCSAVSTLLCCYSSKSRVAMEPSMPTAGLNGRSQAPECSSEPQHRHRPSRLVYASLVLGIGADVPSSERLDDWGTS